MSTVHRSRTPRTLGVIAIAIVLACSKRGGPDVGQLAVAARKLGDQLDQERRDTLAKLPPTVVPRPDLGTCSVAAFKPDPHAPTETPAMSDTIMEDVFLVQRTGFANASELSTKPGPRRKMLDVDLRLVEGQSDPRAPDDVERARKLTQRAWWEQDLVLVIDEIELPKLLDDKTFKSGMLRGRAYVWDFDKSSIVCAAMVYVESSASVKLKVTAGDSVKNAGPEYLRGDLYEQGITAAKKSLVVAGPRRP